MRSFKLSPILLLTMGTIACGDKDSDEPVDTGTAVSDSDTEDTENTDSDTETDTDTASDTDTDTGPEEPTGPQATFQLSEASGMKVGLVQIDFSESDEPVDTAEPQDDGPRFLDTQVVSPELGSEASFSHPLETPEDSVLFEVDPSITARLAMWAPFLFDDANGDDQYTDGETIGGFSDNWLVYSTEAIPAYNVSEGWGVIVMTFTEEVPVSGDIDNVPLQGTLGLTDPLTIGGSYDTSLGDRRIAFVASETIDSANSTMETMAEIPAADPWTVTFSGTPPAHFFPEETDFASATSFPLVYEDSNGNGQFDMAEAWSSSVLSVCTNNTAGSTPQVISVIYTSPITDLRTAMSAGMYGLSAGWSVMTIVNDAPIFLSESERNSLVIDENCVLE